MFDDGLIAIPFSSTSGYDSTGCSNPASGVELVQWANDTLQKDTLLPITGNPRRALDVADHVLAVSDSNVATFALASLTSPDVATATSSVTIGTCVNPSMPGGGGGMGGGDYVGGDMGYGGVDYAGGTCE